MPDNERCAPDDPRRCKGATVSGQCPRYALDGLDYCEFHIKTSAHKKYQKKRVQRYLIDQERLRLAYQRQQDDIHYLDMKDDILLLQTLIEEKINSAKTDIEINQSIPALNALFGRLESMKSTLLKMQRELDLVLGKEALMSIVDDIVEILDDALTGIEDKADRLDIAANRLIEVVENASNKKGDANG